VTYCDGAYDCVDNADACRHRHGMGTVFRALDIERINRSWPCPVIVDLRNIYRPEDMKARASPMSGLAERPRSSQQISVACLIVVRRSRSQAPVIGRHSAVVKPWLPENVLEKQL